MNPGNDAPAAHEAPDAQPRRMRRPRNPWRSLSRESGQSMVEYALVAIPFFLMVMGIFDFGRAFFHFHMLSNAAREGARLAAVGRSSQDVFTTAVNASYLPNITAGSCSPVSSTQWACPAAPNEDLDVSVEQQGTTAQDIDDPLRVRVTLSYKFRAITPLIGNLIGNPRLLVASSTMEVDAIGPTSTPGATPTPYPSFTPLPTNTPTQTPIASATPTMTRTPTVTRTPTRTPTSTTTATLTRTPTVTPTPTVTRTPTTTPTRTNTPTATPTSTPTNTPTATPPPGQCYVPNFIGVTLSGNTARNMWTAAGFTLGNFTKIGSSGNITTQSLPAGSLQTCTTAAITVQ